MYKVLLELIPVDVRDEKSCHDQRLGWMKQLDWMKRID